MKKSVLALTVASLSVINVMCVSNKNNEIPEQIMEQGFENGVSGAFTGRLNEMIIQAGGCNFPVDPLGKDSKKKFYQGIYSIEQDTNGYSPRLIGELPKPLAYGIGVTTPEGLIIIGGSDTVASYKEVYKLGINENKDLIISELPSLPETIDNFAAAYADGKIYVAGGNIGGLPSNKIFTLDLALPDNGWKELPSFPGNPRVQPVMEVGLNKAGEETVYIFGGFAGKGQDREASLNTDGVAFNLKNQEWREIESPKNPAGEDVSLGGGAIVKLNNGKFLATGGVNKDIFLEALRNQPSDYLDHPTEWYRFNPFILAFDPVEETWNVVGETSKTARAGAGMVLDENKVFVLGGELRPRIRTSEVYVINTDSI